MAFCRSALIYIATSLIETRARGGARIGTCDKVGVGVTVPSPLVGAAPAGLFLPVGEGFC